MPVFTNIDVYEIFCNLWAISGFPMLNDYLSPRIVLFSVWKSYNPVLDILLVLNNESY